jgi:hypothetical protein
MIFCFHRRNDCFGVAKNRLHQSILNARRVLEFVHEQMTVGREDRRFDLWIGLDDQLSKATYHRKRKQNRIGRECRSQINELKETCYVRHRQQM